jgi:type VI secretion system protein VasJ
MSEEELITAAKDRIADLIEPIDGGVGQDVTYDEKFEQIKSETDKLASLTGEVCDWSNVAVRAEEILQERSKDFRIACYLAACKMRSDLPGVLDGILLLEELSSRYWDTMHPPLRRLRARAGMLGWMSDQVGPTVQDFKLKAKDGPLVKAVDERSIALDALFREKFGDEYPGISKLREAIRHLVRTVPKEAPPPPPPPPPDKAVAPSPAPSAVAVPSADAGNAAEALKAFAKLGTTMVRLAQTIRAEKPENELVWRMSRIGMWIELEGAPPSNDGRTIVPAPASYLKQRLDTLVSSQDWLALLNEADDMASEYILWLDPHRYVSTAMSALGAIFMKAKNELLLQIALMLRRAPTLPKLAYADGTGFADGPTQMWLENEVLPVLASGDSGGGGGAVSLLDEPIKEARALAVKGELGKALALVSAAAATAPTPAERFRGKLAVAQLCLGAGQNAIARSQLEGLARDIELHRLDGWDPALCAEVYAALYGAIKAMNDAARPTAEAAMMAAGSGEALGPGVHELAAEQAAFEALCRLDPATALKIAGDSRR